MRNENKLYDSVCLAKEAVYLAGEKEKIYWVDSLKLLAAFLVFSTHFLAEYAPAFLVHWEKGHLLYGVSGKLAVGFFFLMSGYFAMYARRENTGKYIVKRYLRLSVPVFIIETVVLILALCYKVIRLEEWMPPEMTGRYLKPEAVNWRFFLSDIFLLSGKVIPTYWGNFMLFSGPVIVVFLHGNSERNDISTGIYKKIRAMLPFAFAGVFFFLLSGGRHEYAWYTVCMSGALLYLFLQKERSWDARIKRVIKMTALLVLVCCVRTPETNIGYVLKGMASFCLVVFVYLDKKIQKLLENKWFKSLANYSFEIYLVHTPVNLMVISFLFGFLQEAGVSYRLTLGLTYLMSLGVTILCGKGLHTAVQKTVTAICGKMI